MMTSPYVKKIELIRQDEVDSTNETLQKLIEQGKAKTTGLIAKTQKKGKGRMERAWLSPLGGLYLSLSYPTKRRSFSPIFYPIAAGVGLVSLLEDRYEIEAKLKWPNDITVDGKKLAGMLSTFATHPETKLEYVIVGIGMNVNAEIALDNDAPTKPILMKSLKNQEIDLKRLSEEIAFGSLAAFDMLTENAPQHLLRKYNEKSYFQKGDKLIVEQTGRKLVGLFEGINENFELQLNVDGKTISITDGDCQRVGEASLTGENP